MLTMGPRTFFLVLCLLFACFVGGCQFGTEREHDRRVAEVATLKASHLDAELKALDENIATLQLAKTRGDELTRRLQSTEAALAEQKMETTREIKRLTTGRACLSAAAVRVLNARTTQSDGASSVPGAASSAAAADASGAASDTDVGLWAADARTLYRQCAERLDALIDWHTAPAQGAAE